MQSVLFNFLSQYFIPDNHELKCKRSTLCVLSIISFIFINMIYHKILALILLKTINRESSEKHSTNTLQVFFYLCIHNEKGGFKTKLLYYHQKTVNIPVMNSLKTTYTKSNCQFKRPHTTLI